jgi:hypothetical protein
MRLPRHPDATFAAEPALWHLLALTIWRSHLTPGPIRRWVTNRWVAAIRRAADARREAESPDGI